MSADELPPLEGVPARVRDGLRALDIAAGVRRLAWVMVVIVVLALAVLVGRGGSRPRDPYVVDQSRRASTRLPGFGETAVTVTGEGARRLCAAVADTEAERERGLMGRTDLAGYDGMLFVFPADTDGQFYMRNTPIPLSIAWFDGTGRYVSSADMAPCPDQSGCPTYAATGPYRMAFEVPQGGLRALGIGPGSSVAVGGAC